MKDSEMTQTSKRPAVFAKFVTKEILGEWGRLLFSLLDTFALSGYEVRLFDSIPRQDLGKYGPLIFSAPTCRTAWRVIGDNRGRCASSFLGIPMDTSGIASTIRPPNCRV